MDLVRSPSPCWGAYGAYLADGSECRGDDPILRRFHRERLEVLGPLADLVACETIPCLREARCLTEDLADHNGAAWVSFCCRDAAHVAHGEPIERCAAALVAIGVNRCAPEHVKGLLLRLPDATSRIPARLPERGRALPGRPVRRSLLMSMDGDGRPETRHSCSRKTTFCRLMPHSLQS